MSLHAIAMPTTRDPVGRILLARGLRDFGDGLVAVLLPAWLLALGYGGAEIGALATIALLGSAAMTLGIGMAGARADPRLLLLLASLLMAATGLGFAAAAGFLAIAAVALVGTANPSAGSVSVFAPLEQALLTQAVPTSATAAIARNPAAAAKPSPVAAISSEASSSSRRGSALAPAMPMPSVIAAEPSNAIVASAPISAPP